MSHLYYLVPVVPFLTRSLVFLTFFRHDMLEQLGEEESDRESHRSIILALAGFSFSGLLALTVVDAATRQNLHLSIYYLLISFLCYFFALNLQGYKFCRWHDQLSDALMEAASLSLMLSVAAIILSSTGNTLYGLGVTFLALGVWLIDHVIRVVLMVQYLRSKGGDK